MALLCERHSRASYGNIGGDMAQSRRVDLVTAVCSGTHRVLN
jgi:hypothetical protein